MEWTSEAIDQLRVLWSEGHSTAEIGRRMGISKNAVVGKAHRLSLPARPSPIRREGAARPGPVRRSPTPARPSLPPLRRLEAAPVPSASVAPRPAPVPAATAPAKAPSAVVRPFPRTNAPSCCWPLGDPGTPEFRFCAAEALPGKPYCTEHAALAYVKVRDRREDAA